jgi:hypothetical protein
MVKCYGRILGEMVLRPCWSCGTTDRDCFSGCQCAKCVDPEGYAEWKANYPERYDTWLQLNLVDSDDLMLEQIEECEMQKIQDQADLEAEIERVEIEAMLEKDDPPEDDVEIEEPEAELEFEALGESDCEPPEFGPEPEEELLPCLRQTFLTQ